MAKSRIRFPKTLTVAGTSVDHVASISWETNDDYDRSKADAQMSGDPVKMDQAGTGQIELLAGTVPACYDQEIVATYEEVVVSSGSESTTTRTATFTKCTHNAGANVPGEGRGSRTINFEFATVTVA